MSSCDEGACITSATRRDDTILRLGGDAFGYPMTWTADDRQLVAACDGAGWPEIPKDHYYSSRLFSISGSPQNATFQDISSYPDVPLWDYLNGSAAPYYSLSMLAIDGRVFQYLSTGSRWAGPDDLGKPDQHFNGAKLIYSPDNGRTWCNQDSSTPVVQELPQNHSHQNMTFLKEPHDAFSLLTFLQMGRDYRDNRDGYVYVYSPNGTTEGTMNQLVMFRVPKAQILDRRAYEYFSGLRADGNANWAKDINERSVVHTFPRGWISPVFPLAWQPSVVYNAPLGLYMMANSNSTGGDAKGYKPSYLGIWVAHNPWGPWTQIHEETAWTPAGDPEARAGWPQIAPKWIAKDGKSFWLVWTDTQQLNGEDVTAPIYHARSEDEFRLVRLRWRECCPYFAFNVQRVDLDIA
jgi:uncharacterized protein DUF4185